LRLFLDLRQAFSTPSKAADRPFLDSRKAFAFKSYSMLPAVLTTPAAGSIPGPKSRENKREFCSHHRRQRLYRLCAH
jgi:hypothetical protein